MRRFGAVRHIAELFDRYAVHRPDMVRGMGARRSNRRAGSPSCGGACASGSVLRAPPSGSPRRACESASDPGLLDLPARLSLFGLTRIPRSYLTCSRRSRTSATCTCSSSTHRRRSGKKSPRSSRPARRSRSRHDDRTATAPANRLLASWGRDVRELQLVLASAGEGSDHHHDAARGRIPDTLLARIQADVREDRQPPGAPLPGEPDLRPRSTRTTERVQIHACHGRARQVEVLRDVVLHLLEDDPTLEPRDVIVMCPDIETFAPLIQATFGSGPPRPRTETRTNRRTTKIGRPTCASGSPTARCARPIRCSASSASCSRSPTSARPRHSCSTWPGAIRSAGASASTTTTCRGCRSGSPRAASDGASTRSTASRSSSARSRPTRGGGASIGCWSASR